MRWKVRCGGCSQEARTETGKLAPPLELLLVQIKIKFGSREMDEILSSPLAPQPSSL